MEMVSLKRLFVEGPPTQVSPEMRFLAERWSNPPTAYEILFTLDCIITSDDEKDEFAVESLKKALYKTLAANSMSYSELAQYAFWRNYQSQ